MSKDIWERHNYTNHDIGMIINGEIIEYDIKAAGLNLAKEFGYIDKKTIEYLESLDKKRRNIHLGLLKKNDKQISKKENEAFIEARRLFIVTLFLYFFLSHFEFHYMHFIIFMNSRSV